MRETATVLACFAFVAVMLASSRWLAGRRRAATGHLLMASITLFLAASLWRVASSLAAYEPIGGDQPIAELLLEQTGARQFRATLTRLPGGRMQVLELPGHQWRIDARTLEWREPATRFGLRPRFQVERITTRDTRPGSAPDTLVADYLLSETTAGDLWAKVHSGARWAVFAVARRSYGPWRPLANGARFQVRLDGRGVAVEPMNEAAAEAMRASR